MAITSAICTSFKVELLKGVHNFTATTGNTFKIALYTSSATLGASTTAFSSSNEITNTSGTAYTSGGATLTSVTPTTSGTNSCLRFCRCKLHRRNVYGKRLLIYNDTATGDPACAGSCFWRRQKQ